MTTKLRVEFARTSAKTMSDYYSRFTRIDEYMRVEKMKQIDKILPTLPGMGHENEFFTDFTMHPNDMDIEVVQISHERWNIMLNLVSSHANMKSIPGKSLQLLVREKNTGKTLGFILMGSPVINCRPRNILLGDTPNLSVFNRTAIMGFIIVPVQPFGYNYLGGKLLAGICCSHKIRRMVNDKYGSNIVMFETTSLYGNSKSSSQYDGMRPFLRNKGLTDSNFVPMIHGQEYLNLVKSFTDEIGVFIPPDASSRKMKTTNAMIGLIKKSLPIEEREEFTKMIDEAKNLTEQKRYYVSNYGIRNYIDIVNGNTTEIIKEVNYDRFEMDKIIDWWKNKSSRRYEKLVSDNTLRNELEIWTPESDIDIIR